MKKIDKLCLVDDDNVFQFLTQKLIEGTHLVAEFKLFSNGQEAIEFLKTSRDKPEELPEVIFLDLSMPIMDGWGFLEEYLLLEPKLKKKIMIYIVSSSIDPADLQRAKSLNAVTDFIVKPITKEGFLELMKSIG